MRKDVIICLDIGGTNCRMGIVDRDGALLERCILSTESLAEKDFVAALTEEILRCIKLYCDQFTARAISIGFPATIDRSKRRVLQVPNIPGLADALPICDLLEAKLGLPTFLEKDVNLLLMHDLQELHLEKDSTIIGIYFGTGIGNSIYMGGKFHSGANGVAGELGHIPQLGQDKLCGCGNRGCIEPLGGGRRLSELCETEFHTTDIKHIYLRHGHEDQVRRQVDVMAAAVATEVNILDPDYVVLGGGLLQMAGFPLPYFEEQIRRHTRKPYPLMNLKLLYARPNQENGIIGAGLYGWACLESKQ